MVLSLFYFFQMIGLLILFLNSNVLFLNICWYKRTPLGYSLFLSTCRDICLGEFQFSHGDIFSFLGMCPQRIMLFFCWKILLIEYSCFLSKQTHVICLISFWEFPHMRFLFSIWGIFSYNILISLGLFFHIGYSFFLLEFPHRIFFISLGLGIFLAKEYSFISLEIFIPIGSFFLWGFSSWDVPVFFLGIFSTGYSYMFCLGTFLWR